MFSYARMRASLGALLSLGLAATALAASAPAAQAAGNSAPVLTSISLVSPKDVKPGDTMRFDYAATDDGGSLSSLRLEYATEDGRTLSWVFGPTQPLSGQATMVVPDYISNGTLTLTNVQIVDSSHMGSTYYRWQTGLDLQPLDLAVSGSTPDTTPPQLTSFALGQESTQVGEVATFSATLEEEHVDYRHSYVEVVNPDGTASLVPMTSAADGQFRRRMTSNAPGTAKVKLVCLRDLAGNTSYYAADHRVFFYPGGVVGPASTLVADKSFHLGLESVLPELTSITGSPVSKAGDVGTMTFTTLGDNPVTSVRATYVKEGYPGAAPFTVTSPVSTPGVATWTVPKVPAGTWHLGSIRLTDSAGNWTDWSRDRTLACSLACPPEHRVDLSRMVISVATPPSAPGNVRPSAGNRSARITWGVPAVENGAPVTGYTVTVSPGGKVYTTSASTRSLTVTGLANDVRHSFAVRAQNLAGAGAATTVAATPRALSRFTGAYDVNSDYRNDIVGINRYGSMYLYKGTGTGGVRTPGTKLTATTSGVRILLDSRKITREGGAELYAVLYNGDLVRYTVGTDGRAYRSDFTARGFDKYRLVVSPGDFNGDGYVDLMGITDSGDLNLVTRGDGHLLSRTVRIGGGWSGFNRVVGVGDVTGDKRNDLLARKKDGTLMLYAGNGKGGFAYARKLSTGWNTYATFAAAGDFNRDGKADVLAVTPSGSLYLYKGNGRGGFATKVRIATGMASFS